MQLWVILKQYFHFVISSHSGLFLAIKNKTGSSISTGKTVQCLKKKKKTTAT